jgi:hypothetical protein
LRLKVRVGFPRGAPLVADGGGFPFSARAYRRRTRYPIATESALQSLFCPVLDSLGDFHHSLSVSLASFAAMVSKSRGPPLLRPERKRPDLSSTIPTQGRLRLHTALRPRSGPMHRIAGSQSASYTGRNTTMGVRPRTRAGLNGNRVGVTMPLEIALRPQARAARFPPAPTQDWASQAGTRGFTDVPFRGFLGPP